MEPIRSCDGGTEANAGWTAGYEAAIDDAVGLIDTLGGTPLSNFSAPVLQHLKARLLELRAQGNRDAA